MALDALALKVNRLVAPLGIDTLPRFSWINKSSTVGQAQTAYQIAVSSAMELAQRHIGDLWDSGKVSGNACFDIPYEGRPLSSRMDCFWSVRVWDETDTAGPWAPFVRFGVGVLQQTEWLAKWISAPTDTGGNKVMPAPMLRKVFSLAHAVKAAKVYICGLGLFELRVNGNLPEDSVLNPADTQYEDTVSYCVYDITQLLKKGKNVLTVELGCGFYKLCTDISVGFKGGVWKDDPKLLLELHVEYENGDKQAILSDESWRCFEDGPLRSDNIYCGEIYDATKEVAGWTDPEFDDRFWKTARLAAAPSGILKFENMEPMRRVRSAVPTLTQLNSTTWLAQCPVFCTGWARITFPNARNGQQIKIRHFQREQERTHGLTLTALDGSGEVYELQSYSYRAKGIPGESFEPKFSYCGYELIEISGYSGQLRPEDIICYTIATDAAQVGTFSCGNAFINQLHDIMVRTMVCNMQGKPTDTPIFEKLGWTGDYNGAIKTFNYNFDVSNFLGHFLHNLRDTALPNGRINEYSPSGIISRYDAPCWTQMYINAIYAAWHENGQFSLIQEHYDYMRKNVSYYLSRMSKGAEPWAWESTQTTAPNKIGNRLGDWAAPNGSLYPKTAPPEGGSLYNTAAVYRVLREFSEIAFAMQDAETAEQCRDAADHIQKDFNRVFYREDKGCYETDYWNGSHTRTKYRQAMNLVALALGLTTPENHDQVLKNLLCDIAQKGNHLDVGSVGAELILPVLSAEGHGDLALKVLQQTDYPSWGYWLKQGASTCLEGWDDSVRSFCHFFLGTYDEWFYQNLGGIQNPRHGYQTVTIRPEIYPELQFVHAGVDTVRGVLRSGWRIADNGELTVTVTVPVGTTADVLLPVPEGSIITLNGTELAMQKGVLAIGIRDGRTLVQVTGGTFCFDLGRHG